MLWYVTYLPGKEDVAMLHCTLKVLSFYAILLTVICGHAQGEKDCCHVMRLADIIVEIIAQKGNETE